jgi:hypothetical protein
VILLFLNYKRLAIPSTKLSFKRMVEFHKLFVIFLQETMMKWDCAIKSLSPSLPEWNFVATHNQDHSRGLLIGWINNSMQPQHSWSVIGGLGTMF